MIDKLGGHGYNKAEGLPKLASNLPPVVAAPVSHEKIVFPKSVTYRNGLAATLDPNIVSGFSSSHSRMRSGNSYVMHLGEWDSKSRQPAMISHRMISESD